MTGNMDEIRVNFNLLNNRTVNIKGEKTILVQTIGNEKRRFSIILACMADGKKFQPVVIFKQGDNAKSHKFPPGIFFTSMNMAGKMRKESPYG